MKNILFIEDENELNAAYRGKFSSNYDISFASESNMGLKLAQTWMPDLIVLDILLPGEMNGIDILRSLKKDQMTENIPILILTNLENQENTTKLLGAVDCLVKSNTSFDLVAQKVEDILSA